MICQQLLGPDSREAKSISCRHFIEKGKDCIEYIVPKIFWPNIGDMIDSRLREESLIQFGIFSLCHFMFDPMFMKFLSNFGLYNFFLFRMETKALLQILKDANWT